MPGKRTHIFFTNAPIAMRRTPCNDVLLAFDGDVISTRMAMLCELGTRLIREGDKLEWQAEL